MPEENRETIRTRGRLLVAVIAAIVVAFLIGMQVEKHSIAQQPQSNAETR